MDLVLSFTFLYLFRKPYQLYLKAFLHLLYLGFMVGKTFDDNVTNLMLAIGLLMRRAHSLVTSNDLSWTQKTVMALLAKEGPATASDLARAEGMKPQSMGTTIAELRELGLIDRKPHSTDGRQMLIELTAKGLAVRKAASEEKRTWLSKAIAQLDEKERDTLFAAGDIIMRLAERAPE
jgi:DNA-binding MarR family transcriptional regulator